MTDLNTCRTKFKLDRSLSVPFSQIPLFSEILSWQTNKIIIHIRDAYGVIMMWWVRGASCIVKNEKILSRYCRITFVHCLILKKNKLTGSMYLACFWTKIIPT